MTKAIGKQTNRETKKKIGKGNLECQVAGMDGC